MKAKSHKQLGHYLVQRYLNDAPSRYIRAFLIGCVEPDKNPTTYLKGSLRCQWLRGHNWGNSQPYIRRVSARLERKQRLRLLDYYQLGKLIHYTTDAFTYAHNEHFQENLKEHCSYELFLQQYFIRYLSGSHVLKMGSQQTVMETILAYHTDYVRNPAGVYTDSRFTVTVCCAVLALLTGKFSVRKQAV